MRLDLWELESYVNQALDDYENLTNDAEKSGKPSLASYYDGVRKGITEVLNYVKWYEGEKDHD